ncbi:MAG: hydrolase [Verrucomicrobiales bacterium]|nr:hydrolase [Verrucomicrobiales bacterium]
MRNITTGILRSVAICALAWGFGEANLFSQNNGRPNPAARPKTNDLYQLGPDSQYQPEIPHGQVIKGRWSSTVYPGTQRDYWVYIPAQYKPEEEACLMVFQDGSSYQSTNASFRATIVYDNLIAKKELPITVVVFVNPGETPAAEPGKKGRSNRSYEYDSLGGKYTHFLVDEFLPAVLKDYKISKDPKKRGIGGISSGGICAFTVAWERPEEFGKVITQVGSFTNIRGGNAYPFLIRRSEKKPIKIFMQDGLADLNNLHGNWPLAAQEMDAALKFAKYEHQLVLGDGGHNGIHGGAILPESLKWLWSDVKP